MIADQFDIFLLDLDGVVHVGDALLPGADVALAGLRSRGRTLRFVTNDPRPTREDVVLRLGRLGVDATVEEIVSSGWATACWLREHRVTRAYVVGSDGLRRELAAQGVEHGEGPDVEAVVVGCDETIGYRHLALAGALVRAGVLFVATNADSTFPTAAGPRPATGAIVAAVQAAGGRRPIVIGKPGPEMFRLARRGLPDDGRVVVVGDTPGTDVAGAHRAGLPAILVAPAPSSRDREQVGPDAAEARITGLPELFAPAVEMRSVRPLPYPWPADVRAGVAAVVFDEAGRVLLGRRVDNGLWGLPSGHVEAGETVVQAVVREVAEETGVRVRPRWLIGVYSDPASQVFAYPDGRVTQFVTTTFACVRVAGQARADAVETSQVAFFPPDRLPTPLLPMHPRWLTDALSGRTGLLDGEGTDDGEITGADDGEIEGTDDGEITGADDGVRPGSGRSARPSSRPS